MSTASAHCGCDFPSDPWELSTLCDMAHSRTSRKGADRRRALSKEGAAASDSGAQYAEVVPTAGGFQAVERRPGRGEIERLPGQVARAVLRRRRPGKQISLRIRAAELAQLLELLPTLDTFRNHLDVQMAGHGDDGTDDGEIAQVRHQVTHETAVDLERIHAPALQVREARVANAEIIDGDAHTELAQARDDVLARLAVACLAPFEHRALRQLDLQQGRFQAVLRGKPGDVFGEIGALQLHGRDIEGDGHELPSRLPPAHCVLDRPLQHEVPDRHDQAGLFRDAHEAVGPHVSMARMLPAQQRLQRHDTVRFHVDDRLIVHVELPALQRGAQARLDGDALFEPAVHAGAEELEVVAAAVFRLVHRRVGVPQQLTHVDAVVRIQRHADTHGRHQRTAVDDHGGAERVVDALGCLVDLPGVLHALQYDHELIPTHAHDDILGAYGRANALRDGLQ